MKNDIVVDKFKGEYTTTQVAVSIAAAAVVVAAGVTVGLLAASTAGVGFAMLAGYGMAELLAGVVIFLGSLIHDK